MQWETVVGLEIHTQLATKSKIFSGAATEFGTKPNTQACAVDLALPGVLPVLNQQAVVMAIKFGLAVNAQINKLSIFARKNYFYPDLPKGYQISQFEIPIVGRGELEIELADGSTKIIGITRAHLEEDAGKSVHDLFDHSTGIDLNRAGTPLLEIVSEPDMRSAQEAIAYAKKIHALVQYLDIGDGNMAEGSFRCDVNVSLRPKMGTKQKMGTRTELKNLNSFKFIQEAITYEVGRQQAILEAGKKVVQETRLYDPSKGQTRPMRSKEDSNDYRYFPDPDLLPLEVDDAMLREISTTLPELADAKCKRFITELGLSKYDAKILTAQKALADYFEDVLAVGKDVKICTNWVLGELSAALNKTQLTISQSPLKAQDLGQLILRITDGTISGKIAKEVFAIMWQKGGGVDEIIEKKALKQLTDNNTITAIIDEIISTNTKQVEQYKNGNTKIFGFFVGQVMKATEGKANPVQVNELLKSKLGSDNDIQ